MIDKISIEEKINFRDNFKAIKKAQELEISFAIAKQAAEDEYFAESLRKRSAKIRRMEIKEDLIKYINSASLFFKSLIKNNGTNAKCNAVKCGKFI